METIVIKRSKDASFEGIFMWLIVTSLPIIGFAYAALTAHRNEDVWMYCGIIVFFLLPSILSFLGYIIPVKAAMILSNEGLLLSPSKRMFDSFAFFKNLYRNRDRLITWDNVAWFSIEAHRHTYYICPTDGTGPTEIDVQKDHLYIINKAGKVEFIFSVHRLTRSSDEILALCKHFKQETITCIVRDCFVPRNDVMEGDKTKAVGSRTRRFKIFCHSER